MSVDRARAASRFVAAALDRHPEWQAPSFHGEARAPGATLRALLDEAAAAPDEPALMALLRRARERELVRIAIRDVEGLAPLDETLAELSDVAEAACRAAIEQSTRGLQARHGVPRSENGEEIRPVVLGMGKLGGRELNFSSDIDLILCYTDRGETDGARALSSDEYFARMVQDLTRIIAARTAEGFVHRVDWMLRPFGSAGAPAASFAAMEDYYQVHGREWERYALVKARPVAGDLVAGGTLLTGLRPFVYRRYLDFNAIGHLRELKRLIEDDVRKKGLEDNVKLGAGGIRELEFIVQSFQLVRGGSESALRDHRLRPVLRYLGEAGHLPATTAAALDQDYVFLRRLENAIQLYADEQTHALPVAPERREALCVAMGAADWPALMREVDRVRERVHGEFTRVFAAAPRRASAPSALRTLLGELWRQRLDAEAARAALAGEGFAEHAGALVDELRTLAEQRLVKAMNEDAEDRLLALLELLFDDARAAAAGLPRALRIVQAVTGRSTYLTLLRENATARQQLLRLCAASPWLSDFIARTPMLLDVLLDPATLYAPPERDELAADLAARFADHAVGATDAGMDLLRRYVKEMTLRIAAADLAGALPLVKVSDRLTWLAEACVGQALHEVRRELQLQYGEPRRSDGAPAGFAVVAYGKFGGLEMGYGSDLDIVFVHDCDDLLADSVGGERPIPAETWLSRCAQRVISWLSAQTPAGRAYEVDIELRPDGRRGMMVASLAGFERYQRESAWTWEHQALTRARFVAGSGEIGAAFERVRREVLMRPREPEKLRADIADMRQKMRAHLEKRAAGTWDVKHGRGGVIDIEFITQYLVLRDAHRDARIVEWSDNWRQLDALAAAGSIAADDKDALIAAYRAYRAFAHACSLQSRQVLAEAGEFTAERERVVGIYDRLLGA